jgi:hypothetical protein
MIQNQQLWARLKAMQIGPDTAEFSFTQRLARENGWSERFASKVVLEYRKFIFLEATSQNGRHVTPSDAVDQVWHLHLTYTRDYWDVMCAQILGLPLHHGPTSGGVAERERYHDQYEATKEQYHNVFGEMPPADIWPTSEIRFAGNWQRIDKAAHFILPRARVLIASVVPATTVLAACSASLNSFSFNDVVIGVLLLIAAVFAVYFGGNLLAGEYDKKGKKKGDGGCSAGGCSFGGGSDCGDGGGGCGG